MINPRDATTKQVFFCDNKVEVLIKDLSDEI